MARARVEFKEDRKGEHRFGVEASNGEPVGGGEGYSDNRDAVRGFFNHLIAYNEAFERLIEDHPEYADLARAEGVRVR